MADLAELQAAILRNQQASGRLAGLDEQYDRANVLRDTPRPQNDRYGGVNVLSGIAGILRRNRGERDIKSIKGEREQARSDIAGGQSMVQGETLRQALAAEKLGADKFAETQSNNLFNQGIATSEETRAERESGAGSGESLTFSDGKNKIPVTNDSMGNLIVAADNAEAGVRKGDPVPDGYTEVDLVGQRGGYVRGIKGSTYDKLSDESNTLRKFNETVGAYEPRFAQLGGVLTGPLNTAIRTLSGQDLLKFAGDKTLTKDARDAAQWWARFKMEYELPERHKIFGATLTNNESASWADAVNAVQHMNPNELKIRLARLQANLGTDFTNRINTWSKAYADNPEAVDALGYMATSTGSINLNPQSGLYEVQQFGDEDVVTQESAPAGANAPPQQLTPEQGIVYGNIIKDMTPEQTAKFQTLTPIQQRQLLDKLYANDGMNE